MGLGVLFVTTLFILSVIGVVVAIKLASRERKLNVKRAAIAKLKELALPTGADSIEVKASLACSFAVGPSYESDDRLIVDVFWFRRKVESVHVSSMDQAFEFMYEFTAQPARRGRALYSLESFRGSL